MKIDIAKENIEYSKKCIRCWYIAQIVSHSDDALDYLWYSCNICQYFDTEVIVKRYSDVPKEELINNK